MAFQLGVPTYTLSRDQPFWSSFKSTEEPHSPKKQDEAPAIGKSPKKQKSAKKSKSSLTKKRARGGSTPTKGSSVTTDQVDRPSSTPAPTTEAFELSETSPRGQSTTRPKHIPIVIPDYESFDRHSPVQERPSGSFSTSYTATSGAPGLQVSQLGSIPRTLTPTPNGERPRHVEIKIPDWAQPVVKRPDGPPRLNLTPSIFVDPFADIVAISPPDMSRPTPDSSRANTMDSNTPSPTGLYINPNNRSSSAYLNSAHSSQSSLVGLRADYESASEAESTHQDARQSSHAHNQSQSGPSPRQSTPPDHTPGSSNANLSGLVCNVHRTTGREPHPLVGATTTILGDKLYVFGGRRLSRAKPQLTSNLYELDLIRRHWTKLETKGDVPPARYFHSVCALGDSKLVCYGGMSPAPGAELGGDGQPEVIVMSDIHIYDAPTRTWQKVATSESPQGRYAHCTAILPSGAVFGSANAPMSAVHHLSLIHI